MEQPHEPLPHDLVAILVEACVETVDESVAAEQAGAGRLELCAGLIEGGTTPSVGLIETVRGSVGIPVFVMVRPRGGDFVHDAAELAIMLRDIDASRSAGAHGLVLGVLTAGNRVDLDAMARLVEAARPLPVTFHRAIDLTPDLDAAFETLVELGVDRVLTSGGAPTAMEGANRLSALRERLGDAITLLAGGGVRAAHAADLARLSGVREVHARPLQTVSSAGQGEFTPRKSLDAGAMRALVDAVRDA